MVRWDKVVIALVLALIPNHMQCLISCMSQAGTKAAPSSPACHHHKGDPEKPAPPPCSPGVVVTAAVFAPAQEGIAVTPPDALQSLRADAQLRVAAPQLEAASFDSLPPGSLFAVLRI